MAQRVPADPPRVWDCMYCGATGVLPPGEALDTYQCPDCGEPVFVR